MSCNAVRRTNPEADRLLKLLAGRGVPVRPLARGDRLDLGAGASAEVLHPPRGWLPSAPLWNPLIMGGRPLLADAQSAVYSPFSVPSYVLPFWKSLGWVAVLKLWVAAL